MRTYTFAGGPQQERPRTNPDHSIDCSQIDAYDCSTIFDKCDGFPSSWLRARRAGTGSGPFQASSSRFSANPLLRQPFLRCCGGATTPQGRVWAEREKADMVDPFVLDPQLVGRAYVAADRHRHGLRDLRASIRRDHRRIDREVSLGIFPGMLLPVAVAFCRSALGRSISDPRGRHFGGHLSSHSSANPSRASLPFGLVGQARGNSDASSFGDGERYEPVVYCFFRSSASQRSYISIVQP